MTNNKGQKVGYVRVSTADQNTERQLVNIELDRCFKDKISGIKSKRPALDEMMDYVRQGDTVIIHSLDRLARDLQVLLGIVKKLTDKGVSVHFVKENLTFNDSTNRNPIDELILHIFGAVAQFQRAIIKEAQREGIEVAKKKGVYKGRKRTLDKEQEKKLKELLIKKSSSVDEFKSMSYADIARQFNISSVTLWRYRKEIEGIQNED